MVSAHEALERLQEGNARYVSAMQRRNTPPDPTHRRELAVGQEPFAVILGCIDSRVPPELIFDQGPGDLFVGRVAGNVATPSQIGNIEFAARYYDVRLAVVLGHTQCGAIQATVDALREQATAPSPHLEAIIGRIRPSVEPLLQTEAGRDGNALVQHAVRENVRASVAELRERSDVLGQLIEDDGLLIVGAEYALESGRVDFFDGAAGTSRRPA